MARRPAAISSVSRARSGRRSVLEPNDCAASTSARAVIDFEPGNRTVVRTGPAAVGASQGADERGGAVVSATRTR
jgi:hypothetical protein